MEEIYSWGKIRSTFVNTETRSLFLYYYLLIIILFSIQTTKLHVSVLTTINLLLLHPLFSVQLTVT